MKDREYVAYVMDTRAFADEDVFDMCLDMVSEYRREKVRKLRMKKDQQASLAAGILLEAELERHACIDRHSITYIKDKKGKPCIYGLNNISFSISHTDGCVAVILGPDPCGIDVEGIRHMPDRIVERLFSDEDISRLDTMKSDEVRKSVYGTSVWTRRESYGKMTGTGIMMSDETQEKVMDSDYMLEKHILLKNFCLSDGEISELCFRKNGWSDGNVPDYGYIIAVSVPDEPKTDMHIEYVDSLQFAESAM